MWRRDHPITFRVLAAEHPKIIIHTTLCARNSRLSSAANRVNITILKTYIIVLCVYARFVQFDKGFHPQHGSMPQLGRIDWVLGHFTVSGGGHPKTCHRPASPFHVSFVVTRCGKSSAYPAFCCLLLFKMFCVGRASDARRGSRTRGCFAVAPLSFCCQSVCCRFEAASSGFTALRGALLHVSWGLVCFFAAFAGCSLEESVQNEG